MSQHQHDGPCCLMSRRRFLAQMSAAALGAVTLGAGGRRLLAADEDLGEYIDLAGFRPRPRVTIRSAFVRVKPPYWLGWPGTSYDVEGHRREYAEQFSKAARGVGVRLDAEREPLESDEAVESFAQRLTAEKPDGALITLQHMGAWHWASRIASAGVPTIIFAPIGTAFTGHVLEISRRPGVHVVSSLEVGAVEQAMRMIRAKRQLEATRLVILAGNDRRETVLERLGTKVCYVPRDLLHQLFERMPVTDEVRQVAAQMRRGAKRIVEPTGQDTLNAARSYITAKRLLRDEGGNALTTDCLGMVGARVVPTPPCMAASIFQDGGVTYGCEADLWAAMGLLLTSYLFDKPGFMNDPVPETAKNLLVAAHCTCGTRLNGFDKPREPYVLRCHSESKLGVAMQVLWRRGQPATLVAFQGPDALILDTGTVVGNVPTPPAGGCRTSVEVEMDRIEDARDVKGFHQVVFYGDHRRDVEAFCQMHGIRVINSPERAPRREAA
ncbi:MAG: hypothetical protein JSV65_09775 [Armatimonadota bacterium]|nr:MAG: hypothetical protein JSV65_09775 [Armatimonadota bacterium]